MATSASAASTAVTLTDSTPPSLAWTRRHCRVGAGVTIAQDSCHRMGTAATYHDGNHHDDCGRPGGQQQQ
ncbi:MAG: hypothetical protein IPF85_15080 [Anaerolineae bacterium]|nr:hypothetical protein [Anaerolineae bacterium]